MYIYTKTILNKCIGLHNYQLLNSLVWILKKIYIILMYNIYIDFLVGF